MIENHKLTNEEFDHLFNPDVTVRQKTQAEEKVTKRFTYIIEKMAELIGRKVEWYDYDNEAGEDRRGFFDSKSYQEEVGFVGEFKQIKNKNFIEYENYFPTKWLCEDFEEKLIQEVANHSAAEIKIKEQKSRETEKYNSMKSSILEKLTPEEICYISFSSPESVQKATEKLAREQRKKMKR